VNYLLDTCVISEPTKRAPNPIVLNWLDEQDEESLFLCVLTLGELENGVARLPASRKRARIRQWIDSDLRSRFEGRILDIDAAVALRWGQLTAAHAATGRSLPVIDGLLVATALVHDLTIVTRNTADLGVGGVQLFDPWAL
jgi:predicted nucleic acid-binding protein